jgi:hypothetical protein
MIFDNPWMSGGAADRAAVVRRIVLSRLMETPGIWPVFGHNSLRLY